jgi:uncharacterized protein YbbC (DUF1343 family)
MIAISVILSRLEIPPVVSMSTMENRCVLKLLLLIWISIALSGSKLLAFNQINTDKSIKIIPGAQQLDKYISILKGKNVGLVVNHSSLVSKTHLADTLTSLGIHVEKIFAPEHGFRGAVDAGTSIEDGRDSRTGIQLISLYGKKLKPDSADLHNVDVIIYDIQDVGVRFYTYISTLHYVMESCAEHRIPLIILDRPNPNGHYVDGPILDTAFRSFIGIDPIPVVYGLTTAELAKMIKGECWIKRCEQLKLIIIPCKNYSHSSRVKLDISPSPNLKNELAILLYPSLCFFEGTVISLGRGTSFPFQVYGHPEMKSHAQFSFKPVSMPESVSPPWKDSLCYGVDLRTKSIHSIYKERKINLTYLIEAYKALGKDSAFFLKNNFIDKLAGTDQFRKQILHGLSEMNIRKTWDSDLKLFKLKSRKYLIYR